MTYKTDSKAILVSVATVLLLAILLAAYFGLKQDWLAFILGGVTVYLLGCIKIDGKSIHG
jgi:hypothetical protein